MARIRSVHPGIFTDEAFMTASFAARQMLIGLWCEARDDGLFEWKPIVLKARLFPADDVNGSELLDELASLKMVKRVQIEGKDYGLVRNFCKFQRPKKPNHGDLLPNEYREYVALEVVSSEPVPHHSPTSTEKPSQMEDGGGKRKEEEGKEKEDTSLRSVCSVGPWPDFDPDKREDLDKLEGMLRLAAGEGVNTTSPNLFDLAAPLGWLEAGADLQKHILPVIRGLCRKPGQRRITSWKYFTGPILEAVQGVGVSGETESKTPQLDALRAELAEQAKQTGETPQ